MPRKLTYTKRRTTSRPSGRKMAATYNKRRATSGRMTARKVKAIARRAANPEKKCFDWANQYIVDTIAGTTNEGTQNPRKMLPNDEDTLLAINQGSAQHERLGNKIRVSGLFHNIDIRIGKVNQAATVSTRATPIIIRFVLVRDKQSNGQNAAWGDIFTSPNNTDTASNYAFDFRRLSNASRFDILKDKTVKLVPQFEVSQTNGAFKYAVYDSKKISMNAVVNDIIDFKSQTTNVSYTALTHNSYHLFCFVDGLIMNMVTSDTLNTGASSEVGYNGVIFSANNYVGTEVYVKVVGRVRYYDN